MDGLLAEISSKRKALDLGGVGEGGPSTTKYMRRAEVERAKEEDERRKREAAETARAQLKAEKLQREAEKAKRLAQLGSPSSARSTPEPLQLAGGKAPEETFNISQAECVRRLRAKGQPIRLFGETDKDRRLRLRALELLEDRSGGRENEFRKVMEAMETSAEEKELNRRARESHAAAARRKEAEAEAEAGAAAGAEAEPGDGMGVGAAGDEEVEMEGGRAADAARRAAEAGPIDLTLIKTDPHKLYPLVYHSLKNVLKEWEMWMDARPDEVKRTTQGRLAAATQVSSAQNMKPLFRDLRKREMSHDILRLMSEIVHHMQTRAYQKANDAYLRLSIGNAAWPIGVTSVGIHDRSAREKIGIDNVAHVLNDEVSRKWIQAVKRLITFSQTVRPPYDSSQMMG